MLRVVQFFRLQQVVRVRQHRESSSQWSSERELCVWQGMTAQEMRPRVTASAVLAELEMVGDDGDGGAELEMAMGRR